MLTALIADPLTAAKRIGGGKRVQAVAEQVLPAGQASTPGQDWGQSNPMEAAK